MIECYFSFFLVTGLTVVALAGFSGVWGGGAFGVAAGLAATAGLAVAFSGVFGAFALAATAVTGAGRPEGFTEGLGGAALVAATDLTGVDSADLALVNAVVMSAAPGGGATAAR